METRSASTGTPSTPSVCSKKLTPYFLLLPLGLVLIIFFVLPILTLANNSLTTGGLEGGYSFSFPFGNYWQVWTEYWPQFLRSFIYAGLATVAAILISYPLAYTIAFKVSARVRPIMLVLVIAPFFTRFLIRTLAWTTVLADDGFVVSIFRTIKLLWVTDLVGLTSDGRVLATPSAVILGLTYNFLRS